MEFRRELRALLDQVPPGRVVRCADLARALGDPRASAAIARTLREGPLLPGAERVVTADGRAVRGTRFRPDATVPPFSGLRRRAPLRRLRAQQVRMAAEVSRRDGFRSLDTVGGVDLSYEGDVGFAALVVLRASDLAVVEEVYVARPVDFPYIPTYLAFRELPLIRAAYRRLSARPTLLLVDGHGQIHPARCGVACMVGVTLDQPTVGVAKNPLVGTPDHRPRIGEAVPVRYEGELLGYALRVGGSTKARYVSTGHRVSLRTAVRVVRELSRTKDPEPLRLAHVRATDWKRRQRKRI